jgi:histone H3/H4
MSDSFKINEQDRWLPIANVDKVMRLSLPENSKISKEAKECMQSCVSEFISFVTSQAAEKCSIEKRKTLNGEDILYALHSLGFEHFAEVLRIYLAKYRIFELEEVEKRRKKYLARKDKLKLKEKPKFINENNKVTKMEFESQNALSFIDSNNLLNSDNNITNNQFMNTDTYWDF